MADEYSALTMVLLRMLAFAPGGDRGSQVADVQAAPKAQPAPAASAARTAAAVPTAYQPDAAASTAPLARHAPAQSPQPPPWVELPPAEGETAAPLGSAALRTAAAPAIAVATAPPPMIASLIPTPLGERWAGLVARLVQSGTISALARELAWQAGLFQIDQDTQPPTWQLQVERDSLRTDALRDKLCQALQTELGQPLQLRLDNAVPTDSPARRDAAERERRQRLAEAAIRSDPLVLELMSQVKSARIVPGSIKPL